jgi:hypothetical protein
VGLEPDEVLDRLAKLPDVQAYAPDEMPDLGDVMPARRFVAELDEEEFRVMIAGSGKEVGEVQGFDGGGGMLRRLYLRGTIKSGDTGTEVALRLEQGRTPRSHWRWLGFLVTGGCAWLWVFVGAAGSFDERLLFVSIFMAFTVPVLAFDLKRLAAARSEKLELYSLMEGLLGPEALAEGERTPYRRRLPAQVED